MKKRYAITIDDLAMRQVKVEAAKAGLTVGDWITSNLRPFDQDLVAWTQTPETRAEYDKVYKEASVDESVKKAIEPDKAKEGRGKISKGLGDIPGDIREEVPHEPKPTIQRDPEHATGVRDPGHYRDFRPAPKPGK